MDDRVSNPLSPATADAPVSPQDAAAPPMPDAAATALPILLMLSTCHLLNDMIQSLLPAMYPLLKAGFNLNEFSCLLARYVQQSA